MHHKHAEPAEARRSIGSPGTGVAEGCYLLCTLQDQPVLLHTEPSPALLIANMETRHTRRHIVLKNEVNFTFIKVKYIFFFVKMRFNFSFCQVHTHLPLLVTASINMSEVTMDTSTFS